MSAHFVAANSRVTCTRILAWCSALEFDNAMDGSLGLESAFGSLNKILGLEDTISLLTKGRSRFGLETPAFKEGASACLTLFNPDEAYTFEEKNILSTSKNSMYLGSELKGRVYGVVNNDQITL